MRGALPRDGTVASTVRGWGSWAWRAAMAVRVRGRIQMAYTHPEKNDTPAFSSPLWLVVARCRLLSGP